MGTKIYRAKAPLRISFIGGGTDVPPYPEEHGGCVLSATIDRYAYVTIIPRKDQEVHVQSLDYGIKTRFHLDRKTVYNGELDLIKATLKVMKVHKGMELFIHSDAPPGSGLGSSSTMTVATIGAVSAYLGQTLTNYEISELAHQIERKELKISGGLQDQYAATFGGFNFIEFFKDKVIVNPLRLRRSFLNEFGYHLLLCYTGKTRLSAEIVKRQTESYIRGNADVLSSMHKTKELTVRMKQLLLTEKVQEFGKGLEEAWRLKKQFDKEITNPHIDKLYKLALKNGAVGGKILGAGGGGYLLFLCRFEKKYLVADALTAAGGEVLPFSFSEAGMETWSVTA